jgi:hypothetical protein
MALADVTHTDAHDLARFEALTIPEQLREIWLNGRETNGNVADALRDIADIKHWRGATLQPWMQTIDRKVWQAGAVGAFLLVMAPIVFKMVDLWKGGIP